MIRWIMAITTAAAAACALTIAAPVTALASTAKPAIVQPDTGQGCNYDNLLSRTSAECTKVVGTGLKVTSISGQFANYRLGNATIYIEYYGPNGHITNTADMFVPSGVTTAWITWHNPNPNANMTPGDYCTEAYTSDGSPIVSDCIQVHT